MSAFKRPALLFQLFVVAVLLSVSLSSSAQSASVSARTDAGRITVGDQVRLFIEAQHNPTESRLVWANIPDTFDHLEIVEKGKIDTIRQGALTLYKQRLLVTGFDSGLFKIPAFIFSVIPASGTPYTIQTDSFLLNVQTVPVDTTKPYRPIKDIILVKGSWLDYIWLIVGLFVFIALAIFAVIYFIKNKKAKPVAAGPPAPVETLQEKALRMLAELDQQQLWQQNRIKEYYTGLTDIVREYIELRFQTPAMELTTDELLQKARRQKDMQKHYDHLAAILYTADLAKFAKAQPLPHEHTAAMEQARQFIISTRPVITETHPNQL